MSALYLVALVLSAAPPAQVVTDGATPQAMLSGTISFGTVSAGTGDFTDAVTEYANSLAAAAAKSRSAAQWRRYVSETLVRTAKQQRHDLEGAAAEVLRVYQELPLATQLRPQDREDLRQQLRSRLLQQQQKLVDQIRPNRPTILAQQLPIGNRQPANPSPTAAAGAQFLDVVKSIRPNMWTDNGGPGVALLWQFGAQPALVVGGGAGGGGGGGGVLAQQGVGGFGMNGAAGVGAVQQPADNGKELADLTQAVVAPQTWEANGGPGSIRYFAPVHAFVIRQTGEIHDQLGDLLNQLRKN